MEVTVSKPKATSKRPKGVLTLRQIRNRVGEGWAVIKNPEHEKGMLVRGELLYHSSDRLDALEEMGKCKNGHFAFKFCGKRDPNAIYLL